MKGFFTSDKLQSKSHPTGKVTSCASCGLYKHVTSPRMEPYGAFRKGILNVGEAPGETEDKRGRQWQGKAGGRLERTYEDMGIDLFKDCLNINAVNCRPMTPDKSANRTPTSQEIACCQSRVLKVIAEHKPKLIVALGGPAMESLLSHRWKKDLGGIGRWRGWAIPDRDFGAWLCPTYHPSYIERSQGKEEETIWTQDLKRLLKKVATPFPDWKDEKQYVKIISDLSPLRDLPNIVAIDYETTGLKPHADGHRIVCASVAISPHLVYSFMFPENETDKRIFIKLLRNPQVGKIAHNIKFEEAWSVNRVGCSVKNWQWDTMLATHLLDNRTAVTGLKFQVYVNFGVPDYDSEVESYLKARDNSGNSFNKIQTLLDKPGGREKILTYCGLDSLYSLKLAFKQMEVVRK